MCLPGDPASADVRVFLSVVIPAHNEAGCIEETLQSISAALNNAGLSDVELIVVNDSSTDETGRILNRLSSAEPRLVVIDNDPPHGFGFAVRKGLDAARGEAVCVMMADLSDSPDDLIRYYHLLRNGAECVFGSRFLKGSQLADYPRFKLIVNRLANWFIQALFRLPYNDTTNAFKAYRREVIEGVRPILSHHFNLTVELPLKAVVRGYRYEVIPISWRNRTAGSSKLQMKEMGSRYLFIVLYVFLEKLLSKGDYNRTCNIRETAGQSAHPETEHRTAVAAEGRRART